MHGDLGSYLRRTRKAFPEASARRQIASLLEVLVKLHRRQMLHRDLTPFNVFVCEGTTLKLGDFGIARQQLDRRGVIARTMNPFVAPKEFLVGDARRWQARIGHRHRRYEAADELIAALKAPVVKLRAGGLTSLRGVHLAFTGILARPRRDAIAAATRAGAVVHGSPSARTTVVVRGRPNPQQAAGPDAGLKLMELKRLREKGHRITLIGETRFWTLVGTAGSAGR